jgi:hypothetical protein
MHIARGKIAQMQFSQNSRWLLYEFIMLVLNHISVYLLERASDSQFSSTASM